MKDRCESCRYHYNDRCYCKLPANGSFKSSSDSAACNAYSSKTKKHDDNVPRLNGDIYVVPVRIASYMFLQGLLNCYEIELSNGCKVRMPANDFSSEILLSENDYELVLRRRSDK